jgi:hypothetical protein
VQEVPHRKGSRRKSLTWIQLSNDSFDWPLLLYSQTTCEAPADEQPPVYADIFCQARIYSAVRAIDHGIHQLGDSINTILLVDCANELFSASRLCPGEFSVHLLGGSKTLTVLRSFAGSLRNVPYRTVRCSWAMLPDVNVKPKSGKIATTLW